MWPSSRRDSALVEYELSPAAEAGAGAEAGVGRGGIDPSKPVLHLRQDPARSRRYIPYAPLQDGWEITKIVLRGFSVALSMTLITLSTLVQIDEQLYGDVDISFLCIIIVCPAVILWDVSEFITLCCRRGYGIAAKAHIGLEITLTLGLGAAVGMLYWQWFSAMWFDDTTNFRWVQVALLPCLMIIHFVLFVRSCVDVAKGKVLTPRVMYLPTGQPVVVLPRPYPPRPTHEEVECSLQRSSTAQEPGPAIPAVPTPTYRPSSPPPTEPAPISPVAGTAPTEHFVPKASLEEPRLSNAGEFLPAVAGGSSAPAPKRKPVPVRGTHFAKPAVDEPGPSYVPDDAERARAARGEAQAQWVFMDGLDVVRRPGGPGEKFLSQSSN